MKKKPIEPMKLMKPEKKKKDFKKLLLIISLIYIIGISITGCAVLTKPTPPPISIPQIVSMCKNHIAENKIISRLRASNEVFYLNAAEVIKLHKQGVCTKVLNYMLKTGIRAREERAAIRGAMHRWRWFDGQWYFGPPFGPWIGPGQYWRY